MDPETKPEPAPNEGPPSVTSDTRRLPIADGGLGPLDSDDIEWLIENGVVWVPTQR